MTPTNKGLSLESAINLSRLILRFGQTFRVTTDKQGRLESDTTHTLMLGLLAGEMAAHEVIELDRGAVIAMALVHDLAEAYAGDVSTIRALSAEEKETKEIRERLALAIIKVELAGFPWVLWLIERYEAQACPESRFVKYLDKVCPKLTHRDNGCAIPIAQGMTLEECRERHQTQGAELAAKYPEFKGVKALFDAACLDSEQQWGKQ